jgi:hypothetical protein
MTKSKILATATFFALCSQIALAKGPQPAGHMSLPVFTVTQAQFDEMMEKLKGKGRPVIDLGEVKSPITKHPHHPTPQKVNCVNLMPEDCLAIFDIVCDYGCGVCFRH